MAPLHNPPKQTLQRCIHGYDMTFIASGREQCSPHQRQGPNAHAYKLLHFVVSGQGHLYCNDRHYKIKNGECFYIPENATAFYHADQVDPWTYLWLDFKGEQSDQIIDSCGFTSSNLVLKLEDVHEITSIIAKTLPYYEPSPASDLAIQSYMLLALSSLERQAKAQHSAKELVDNALVKKLIFYIQDHIDEPMSVNRLAADLYVSRGYLSRIFRNDMHITLREFILESKMSKAGELLTKTTMTIGDVARACGYTSQFSFSRVFKTRTSISPTDFRRLYSKPLKVISV